MNLGKGGERLTWRKLGSLIAQMTDAQLDKDVMWLADNSDDIYPLAYGYMRDPSYAYSSRLIQLCKSSTFPDDNDFDPNQFVLEPYIGDEAEVACEVARYTENIHDYLKYKDCTFAKLQSCRHKRDDAIKRLAEIRDKA